jgi:hypothetical protein
MWALNSRSNSYFVSLTRRSLSFLLPPPCKSGHRVSKNFIFSLVLLEILSKDYEIVNIHVNILVIWIVVLMGFLALYVGHRVIKVFTQ